MAQFDSVALPLLAASPCIFCHAAFDLILRTELLLSGQYRWRALLGWATDDFPEVCRVRFAVSSVV